MKCMVHAHGSYTDTYSKLTAVNMAQMKNMKNGTLGKNGFILLLIVFHYFMKALEFMYIKWNFKQNIFIL